MPSVQPLMSKVGPSAPSAPMMTAVSLHTASSPALTVIRPSVIVRALSALMPSFGAVMFRVISEIVRLASPNSSSEAPALTPFLPFAAMISVPFPHRSTCAPSLDFSTAFSVFPLAGFVSSLLSTVSARVLTEPSAATIVTSVPLLHEMAAVPTAVSSRSSRTSVTSFVPFLTVTDPFAQLPLRVYIPGVRMVTSVPSILTASSFASVRTPLSEKMMSAAPSSAISAV